MKINHKKVEQLKSFEGVELKGSETFDELLEIEKEQENKKLIESTIKNILPKNDRSKLINCNGDDFFNKEKKELIKGTIICKAKKCNNYLYKNQSTSNREYCSECL